MDQPLHVDPLDLHHSGTRTAELHEDSRTIFSRTHAEATGAVAAGWVGQSAEAMTAYLDEARAAPTRIVSQLSEHSRHFHTAANGYTSTDQQNGTRVGDAGGSLKLNI